jgi:predicted aspartyl protease
MSQLYVPVILRNAREYVLARHGHLAPEQVHTYESPRALIDTGALHVVLPPYVAEQLGLLLLGSTGTTMADGRLVEGELSEPVLIEIVRRQIPLAAIVMGDTILLGAMVLEGLDLAVDCARGQLMPNLGTWDQPVFRV